MSAGSAGNLSAGRSRSKDPGRLNRFYVFRVEKVGKCIRVKRERQTHGPILRLRCATPRRSAAEPQERVSRRAHVVAWSEREPGAVDIWIEVEELVDARDAHHRGQTRLDAGELDVAAVAGETLVEAEQDADAVAGDVFQGSAVHDDLRKTGLDERFEIG